MTQEDVLEGYLEGTKTIIENNVDPQYIQKGYGILDEDNKLHLNAYETMYLLDREKLVVKDKNNKILNKEHLVKLFTTSNPQFLLNYLVYKNLRNRGYIVKDGINNLLAFRMYPRGARINEDVAKIFIQPLSEDVLVNLERIDKMIKTAHWLKKKLVFAVVDCLGDITYYNASELELKNISEDKDFVF